ncbi:MAG: trypsin-like serine protease [Acidobacteria bacterium]|nr:trypsin-like serine protease [Acidobacteriota bacterium]
MRKQSASVLSLVLLATSSPLHAIVGGSVDSGDQIRAVVNINGCSGTLISDRVVLTAAHCYGRKVTGCSAPYQPKQASNPPGPLASAGTVRIPAPGQTKFSQPGEDVYYIEGFRVMPGYAWDVVDTCCGGSSSGCDFCPTDPDYAGTNFAAANVTTQVRDVAVVYLDRPVTGIAPEEVLFEVGPTAKYAIDPFGLVDTDVVLAGTSRVSSDPTRQRAFGVAKLWGMADSDTVALEEPVCSLSGQTIVTYSGQSSTFQYRPAATGTACFVPGDSGGPNFVNALSLGGAAVPGVPAGTRLVAAVNSGGSYGATDNCDAVIQSQSALTYNFEYDFNGQLVLAQNGDFIRKALDDFDADGIPNDFDNCPTVKNHDQANCNADAEEAHGYPERGDKCDPIPCAHARPEPAKLAIASSSDGQFIKVLTGVTVLEDFEIDPLASERFYNGSNNGDDTGALTAEQVPTKYRFCQIDPALNVNCNNQTIDNGFANLSNGVIGPARPYLHITMNDLQPVGPAFDQEPFDYGITPPTLRRWNYAADASLWTSNGWISTPGTTVPATTGLDGRYWVHSDTDVGRFSSPIGATGYRLKTDGTVSVADQHLSNHYQWLAPDTAFSLLHVEPLEPWPYFDWKIAWDLSESLGPIWGGEVLADAKMVGSEGGHYSLVTPDGTGLVIDEYLGGGIKDLLADESLVWVGAAEASADQTLVKSHESPVAVAFRSDGTDIVDGAFRVENQAGNAEDMGAADLARWEGPQERAEFVGVYSRADDLAFVVGEGEVWFRPVVGEGGWQPAALAEGYEPANVLAATWSFRDQMLWILDAAEGLARLTRLHPFTGFSQLVAEWPYSGRYDRQWLRLALDGNVLLFSSSTGGDTHGIALFHSEGMNTAAPVMVTALHFDDKSLVYEPTVDRRGLSLAVPGEREGIRLLRHDTVPGRAAALEDLAPLFE